MTQHAHPSRVTASDFGSDIARKLITANPWFADLPSELVDEFALGARLRQFADKSLVAKRNEPLTTAGLIVDGALSAVSQSPGGDEFVLSMLPKGSAFGFIALIDDLPNPVDIRACGPTTLLALSIPALRTALATHPQFLRNCANALCHRLRKAYTIVEDVVLGNIEQRVARRLFALAINRAGQSSPIDLHVNQTDLSRMVHADRSTVNRSLKKLERGGIVHIRYGRIEILDIDRLSCLVATQPTYAH